MAAPVPYAYQPAPQAYTSAVKYVNPYTASSRSGSAVFTDRHAVSLHVATFISYFIVWKGKDTLTVDRSIGAELIPVDRQSPHG